MLKLRKSDKGRSSKPSHYNYLFLEFKKDEQKQLFLINNMYTFQKRASCSGLWRGYSKIQNFKVYIYSNELTGKSSLFYLCLILFCFCHQRNQTQFYVVLIVKSSDEECVSGERFAEPRTGEPVSKDPHSVGNVMNLQVK